MGYETDRLPDHPAVDGPYEPEALRGVEKGRRRNELILIVEHPDEELVLNDFVALEVENRLGVEHETSPGQRLADELFTGQARIEARLPILVGLEHRELIAPLAFRPIERLVGAGQDLFRTRTLLGEERDTRARGDPDRLLAHVNEVVADRFQQALDHEVHATRLGLGHQYREFVPIEPRQEVVRADRLAKHM